MICPININSSVNITFSLIFKLLAKLFKYFYMKHGVKFLVCHMFPLLIQTLFFTQYLFCFIFCLHLTPVLVLVALFHVHCASQKYKYIDQLKTPILVQCDALFRSIQYLDILLHYRYFRPPSNTPCKHW